MAAPSYSEDLTDISLAEGSTTGYLQVNFAGGGGGALDFGPDFSMQGNDAILRQVSNNDRGTAFDNGATIAGTVATGVHIYQWGFVATPGITDSLQNGGATVFAGTGSGDVIKYHVEGSDTFGAQGRVGICYAYRYDTSSTASEPYRTVVGSPGATPSVFGFSMKTIGTSKGVNLGCDAVRYGTGAYLTAGELISDGDASDNPCTFAGFAAQNDSANNRWGILSLAGATYELQGKFVIGQTNAKVATTCKFQDSNRSIACVDATHAEFDFCEIVVDGASTICNLTNINFATLGPWQKGLFTVNAGTVTISGGTWSNIGTIDFGTGTTATGLFIQNGETTTLGTGSTVTDCRFSWVRRDDPELTASTNDINGLIVNNFNQISSCRFSGSAGHHVYVNGTFSAGTTVVNWDSTIDGTASISDINVDVPSGATLNVNVSGTTPTFTNRAGTPGSINIVANQVTLTITNIVADSDVVIYTAGTTTKLQDDQDITGTTSAYTYTFAPSTFVDIKVYRDGYVPYFVYGFELGSTNASLPVAQVLDRNYVP